jgi:THO complex subunit 2 N-terminus
MLHAGIWNRQSGPLSGAIRLCGFGKCRTYSRQSFVRQERDKNKDGVVVSLVIAIFKLSLKCTFQSYKQNKFNLLREQSEGYSKLTVELTSSLGPPHSSLTGRPTESNSVIEDRARPVWEKVISLIGYFDLDPNRALDIILDVLSQHLTTHYSFFLALLSFSPWSGSYRRAPPEDDAASMKVDVPAGAFKGKTLDAVLTLAELNSMPSDANTRKTGARVLAQVLGFKFNYYQVRFHSAHSTL